MCPCKIDKNEVLLGIKIMAQCENHFLNYSTPSSSYKSSFVSIRKLLESLLTVKDCSTKCCGK